MAVNVQASVEAQIFGANVLGMLSRQQTEDTNNKITTTKFLLTPSELVGNKPFGVADVVKEINRTIYKIENNLQDIPESTQIDTYVNVADVENAMELVGLKGAQLTFIQTFIYYKKVKKTAKTPSDQNNTEVTKDFVDKPEIEYAIGIHITSDNPHSDDFQFLTIREAYINVWNTDRQKVLERMKIWTEEQLDA